MVWLREYRTFAIESLLENKRSFADRKHTFRQKFGLGQRDNVAEGEPTKKSRERRPGEHVHVLQELTNGPKQPSLRRIASAHHLPCMPIRRLALEDVGYHVTRAAARGHTGTKIDCFYYAM